MKDEASLRTEICAIGRHLCQLGLTPGASGNISARLEDGRLLMTPTGGALGRLSPDSLSLLDAHGRHLSGGTPTKETPLHLAFYETRGEKTGAVIHLHSTYAVALSMMPWVNPDSALPPLTPYSIMRIGHLKMLPFFRPGDPAMADAIRELAGKFCAVLLANHGPVVSGRSLNDTLFAMEELEETARLALITHGLNPNVLEAGQIKDIIATFGAAS